MCMLDLSRALSSVAIEIPAVLSLTPILYKVIIWKLIQWVVLGAILWGQSNHELWSTILCPNRETLKCLRTFFGSSCHVDSLHLHSSGSFIYNRTESFRSRGRSIREAFTHWFVQTWPKLLLSARPSNAHTDRRILSFSPYLL